MPTKQGSLTMLADPVALPLLQSTIPARLAYNWTDGTPRVVPIWFHWNGEQFWLWSPPTAPKIKALRDTTKVALTIDRNEWPIKVLMVRGTASVAEGDAKAPEYVTMVERYIGAELARGWVEQYSTMFPQTVRITVQPEWAGIIDLETRFPSAIEGAMGS